MQPVNAPTVTTPALTIPVMLTLGRIALIPVFVAACYLPFDWANVLAAGLFALAAVTDWLDGYLARRWRQTSEFGAFLDPVADKLMVVAALIVLLEQHASVWLALPVLLIVSREIGMSAAREWMARVGRCAAIQVAWLGKVKTTTQMAAIALLLIREPLFGLPVWEPAMGLLYVAALLTLWSMWRYLHAAWRAPQ